MIELFVKKVNWSDRNLHVVRDYNAVEKLRRSIKALKVPVVRPILGCITRIKPVRLANPGKPVKERRCLRQKYSTESITFEIFGKAYYKIL